MGLFDRFRKSEPDSAPKPNAKPQEPAKPLAVEPDTMCLLLMDRVLEDVDPVAARLADVFGPGAVSEVDHSHPKVPAFTVTPDGLEFWVSYLPMPVPKDELDVAYAAQYNIFLTPEERQAFAVNRSFWVLAQKGGGASLAEKRRVCWAFSRLCLALLDMDGAVGVSVNNKGLLVSKRTYLGYREQLSVPAWSAETGWFPVPLWVWLYGGTHQSKPTFQTGGLADFGFPELGFLDPKRPVEQLIDPLFRMSNLEISERQIFQDNTAVSIDQNTRVDCRRDGDTLFLFGA